MLGWWGWGRGGKGVCGCHDHSRGPTLPHAYPRAQFVNMREICLTHLFLYHLIVIFFMEVKYILCGTTLFYLCYSCLLHVQCTDYCMMPGKKMNRGPVTHSS